MAHDIAAVALDGVWFRHVGAGAAPLARPDPPRDARWQRGEARDALYLADEPDTAWAEWYRWLAEHGLRPSAGLPRDLWRIALRLGRVADLRAERTLGSLGLGRPRPTRADWPAFQAAGERLAGAGYEGLLAPSAARPGGVVLCVFWPPAATARIAPLGKPERIDEPPVPPRGLRT